MPWAKLDESFPDHPKVAGLSDKAFRLHITAICYCARMLTDGEVPTHILSRIGATQKLAAELQTAGLWESTSRGSWLIHDYLEYNPTRADVEAVRTKRQAAGQAGGKASGQARAKQIVEPNAKQIVGDSFEQNRTPSRPVPYTPKGVSEDTLPLEVTEVRDLLLSKLSGKFQRDPVTWDEAEQFGRDFAGQHVAVSVAIEECRRTPESQGGGVPFPQRVRAFMPGGKPEPKERLYREEGIFAPGN